MNKLGTFCIHLPVPLLVKENDLILKLSSSSSGTASWGGGTSKNAADFLCVVLLRDEPRLESPPPSPSSLPV